VRRGEYFSPAGGDVDGADDADGGYDRPAAAAPQQRRSPEMAVPTSAAAAAAAAATATAAAAATAGGGFRPSASAPFAPRAAQPAEGRVRRAGTYSHGGPPAGAGAHMRDRSGEHRWQRRREQEREQDRAREQQQGPRIALPQGEGRRRRSGGRSPRSRSRSRSRSRDGDGLGGAFGVGLREVDRRSRSTDARMLGEGWRRDGAATWGGAAGRHAAEDGEERELVSGSSRERERIRRRERYVEGVDGRRYP
jgi:hypothetical protein